jgi:hypothetical protein
MGCSRGYGERSEEREQRLLLNGFQLVGVQPNSAARFTMVEHDVLVSVARELLQERSVLALGASRWRALDGSRFKPPPLDQHGRDHLRKAVEVGVTQPLAAAGSALLLLNVVFRLPPLGRGGDAAEIRVVTERRVAAFVAALMRDDWDDVSES